MTVIDPDGRRPLQQHMFSFPQVGGAPAARQHILPRSTRAEQ
jgi:hypothetical protein